MSKSEGAAAFRLPNAAPEIENGCSRGIPSALANENLSSHAHTLAPAGCFLLARSTFQHAVRPCRQCLRGHTSTTPKALSSRSGRSDLQLLLSHFELDQLTRAVHLKTCQVRTSGSCSQITRSKDKKDVAHFAGCLCDFARIVDGSDAVYSRTRNRTSVC